MIRFSRTENIFIKAETTFGAEAGSTNGSDMTWVPLAGTPTLTHQIEILEQPVQTGRTMRNAHITGSDKAEVSFEVYHHALSGASGHATALAANDAIDLLMLNVFGQVRGVTGSNASAVTSTTVSLAQGLVQDLLPVHGTSSLSPARVQWVQSLSEALGVQTFSPSLEATPTSPLVYGRKQYFQDHVSGTQGLGSLSMAYRKGSITYTLLGGRVSSMSLDAPRGGLSKWKVSMIFDSVSDGTATKTSLPTITKLNQPVLKNVASPVYWKGTKLSNVESIQIDLGIQMKELPAQEGGNGRSDYIIEALDPSITVTTMRPNSLLADFRQAIQGRLLCQIGSGAPFSGASTLYVPTSAICLDNCQILSYTEEDKDGMISYKTQYKLADQGTYGATSVQARGFQFARC